MPSPKLVVFDVGHGSCVFIEDGLVTTVIDCKNSTLFIEYLLDRKIASITQVIISHADADHIAGILALVQSDYISVGTVFVNPDASKDSEMWRVLRIALQDAVSRGKLTVRTEIGDSMSGDLKHADVGIEVIAPSIASRLSGPGGSTGQGDNATTNTMSVVLRLTHEGHPVMLLAGDLDKAGLADLVALRKDLTSDIILFPHHGGHISHAKTAEDRKLDNVNFTKEMANLVKPKLALFSIGRGQHSTPRPEIIESLTTECPACYIHCSQLSEHCRSDDIVDEMTHLTDLVPSYGKSTKKCCGGSLEIIFAGIKTVEQLELSGHKEFVVKHATKALCKCSTTLGSSKCTIT